MNHGESVALTSAVAFVPGSFLSREHFYTPSPSNPFFYHLPHSVADISCLGVVIQFLLQHLLVELLVNTAGAVISVAWRSNAFSSTR